MLFAGDVPPRAHAAAAEFRADRVACRDRDDDVQHGRQHGAQQELRVVQRRDWSAHIPRAPGPVSLRMRRRVRCVCRRDGGGGGRDRVLNALRGVVAGREELRVGEGDRARGAAGQQVLARTPAAGRSRRSPVPARIALAAAPRSLARSVMAIPGAAATVCTNRRDVTEWSISTTTTPRPRTTALLNVRPSTANAITGTPNSRKRATGSRPIQRTSRAATASSPGRGVS